MALVEDRYRGTEKYRRARDEMIQAARRGDTIYCSRVASIMGLPETGNYMGLEVGHMGGEISEDEHAERRPMLSAVVVRKGTGIPGSGFFDLARGLGKLQGTSELAKRRFWEEEVRAVYATWQADPEAE